MTDGDKIALFREITGVPAWIRPETLFVSQKMITAAPEGTSLHIPSGGGSLLNYRSEDNSDYEPFIRTPTAPIQWTLSALPGPSDDDSAFQNPAALQPFGISVPSVLMPTP